MLSFYFLEKGQGMVSPPHFTYNSQDECQARATQVQPECNTTDTSVTRVRHKRYTNGTNATQEKNFEFDNETSKNIFSHPYISYMANERLQGEEQFHSKIYLLDMHCSNAFKKSPTKTELCNRKSHIKKLYTRLQLQIPLHITAQLPIVTQPRFR